MTIRKRGGGAMGGKGPGVAWACVLAALGATGGGCTWGDEEDARFQQWKKDFCEAINSYRAQSLEIAAKRGAKDKKDGEAFEREADDNWHRMWTEKLEGIAKYRYCNEDLVRQAFRDALILLEQVGQHAGPIVSLVNKLAQEYKIDISAKVEVRPKGTAPVSRRFVITAESSLVARETKTLGILPLDHSFGVRGDVRASFEAYDRTLRVQVEGLRWIVDLGFGTGDCVTFAAQAGGFALDAVPDDAVFTGGWKAPYRGVLRIGFSTRADGAGAAEAPHLASLDFFFDRDLERLAVSTLGMRPAESVFPSPFPPAPDTRVWDFGPADPLAFGRETVVFADGVAPGAVLEVFASEGMTFPEGELQGAPWLLDSRAQRSIGKAVADASGYAWVPYTPDPAAPGRSVYLQGLVSAGDGRKATAVFAAEVRVPFRRGDANSDGRVDLADAVFAFHYLFGGGLEPGCFGAIDADASGTADISDPIRILYWLYDRGEMPPSPGPYFCDVDPERVACDSYPPCQ